MSKNHFPPGWNEERVQSVLAHYETQTDAGAMAEDEAAYETRPRTTMMEVPTELVTAVRDLIARSKP